VFAPDQERIVSRDRLGWREMSGLNVQLDPRVLAFTLGLSGSRNCIR
jgi:hypothetical protein